MRLLHSTPAPPHKVTVFLPARKSPTRPRSSCLLMETGVRERLIAAPGATPHATSTPQKRGLKVSSGFLRRWNRGSPPNERAKYVKPAFPSLGKTAQFAHP